MQACVRRLPTMATPEHCPETQLVDVEPPSSLVSAELRLGHTFTALGGGAWRRPLCLRGMTADGRHVFLADGVEPAAPGDAASHEAVLRQRCEGGLAIASWSAGARDQRAPWQRLISTARQAAAGDPGAATEPASSAAVLAAGASSDSAALAAWRVLEPSMTDPDVVACASEYFPLGPTRPSSRSFLRLRLGRADRLGDQIFLVPRECQDGNGDPIQSPDAAHTLLLHRPVPSWRAWLPPGACSAFQSLAVGLGFRAAREHGGAEELRLRGVRVVDEPEPLMRPLGLTLPQLQGALLVGGGEGAVGSAGFRGGAATHGPYGFLAGLPWSQLWRVRCVEEHSRPAGLGFWGWLFRLRHSVLAVHLRRDGSGTEDTLYLDKNADLGVSWRRLGLWERFDESPRPSYSFEADMSLQDLWSAVVATKAFHEPQEVSNCQHFVREALAELAARGCIAPLPGGQEPSLRNQTVAEALRRFGYLGDDYKPPSAAAGDDRARRGWQVLMSWGCKAGAAQRLSPWIEAFTLQTATATATSFSAAAVGEGRCGEGGRQAANAVAWTL